MKLLEAYPNANQDPRIPDTLLEGSTRFSTKADPFGCLDSLMTHRVIFQVPTMAACEIGERACNVFIETKGKTKMQSALGTLADKLPKITWDRENLSRCAHPLVWVAPMALWPPTCLAVLILAYLVFLVTIPPWLAGSFLIVSSIFLIIATWISYACPNPSGSYVFRCRRPDLGPQTKEKIRDLTAKGWDELHLVWPAEENWNVDMKNFTQSDYAYKETEMLVVGIHGKNIRVVERIADRNL